MLKIFYKTIIHKLNRITSQDVMIFMRQFSTLIHAGIPILQAIEAIKNSCEKQSLKIMLQKLKKKLQKDILYRKH